MADPFSIVAGVISCADVAFRLTIFIKQVKDGTETIDKDLDDILREIEALTSINESIKQIFERDFQREKDESEVEKETSTHVWKEIVVVLEDCRKTLVDFDALLTKIMGNQNSRAPAAIKAIRKTLRKMLKEEQLVHVREKLSTHHRLLELMLTAVSINETRKLQSTSEESFLRMSEEIQALGEELRLEISNFKSSHEVKKFSRTLSWAEAVVPLASLNEHFHPPKAVSSLYTGRQSEIEQLLCAFTAPRPPELAAQQKRFVIYGLSGSGKTQFCCKFAQDNRQRFWGVFWVDASSEEGRKQTFARIASLGKVEPKEASAKAWLSSSKKPWLLIIDNANDPNLRVEDLFPEGEQGFIIITTRNPSLKVHGTLTPRSFHFNELNEKDSHELLLKAADEPSPWSVKAYKEAAKICTALGFLPLAVVQAGKSILSRLCTLETYLILFEKFFSHWKNYSQDDAVLESNEARVYSSYELTFRGLQNRGTQASEDAIELLKLFSFLHRQHIRVEILVKAAENPSIEAREAKKKQELQKASNTAQKTWSQWGKELIRSFVITLMRMGETPILPKVLRELGRSGGLDEFRLRAALTQLSEMSLIEHNPADDSYSMHALIHRWVRERREMSLKEQAVWCQAASTVLSQAILFPHLGGGSKRDEELQRDLLPHVAHVQRREGLIRKQIEENQASRKKPWPSLERQLSRREAGQMAKFSLVYMHNGQYQNALSLQLQVAEFVRGLLGLEDPTTIALNLLISGTYWILGEGTKAANLQQELLEACLKKNGERDATTLMVMDKLGVSRWQQGRFQEAKELHERAVSKLIQLHGRNHHDTLEAMTHLGCDEGKLLNLDEAVRLHSLAAEGLSKDDQRGPSHTQTLIAKENLALAHLDRFRYGDEQDPADLKKAQEIEEEVLRIRTKELGKEHAYTLLALCNTARIKACHGQLTEAEQILRSGTVVAERTLGPSHFGTLLGKMHLGYILLLQNKLVESERILKYVVDTNEAEKTENPDRLVAMMYLQICYRLAGKGDEAEALQTRLMREVREVFGEGGPWEELIGKFRRMHEGAKAHELES